MPDTFHAGPNLGKLSNVTIIHGDCIDAMAELAADSIDAIVTDPPYGLGFMGKAWDDLPPGLDWAKQCLRVLKPGGHLLAFSGTRTWHRLAVAIEDAGFEIRDSIAWLYGSGFPKSLDVSKAIDKAAGATREVVGAGQYANRGRRTDNRVYGAATSSDSESITAPATPEAEQWSGWGTALKPAFEPVVVARKPIGGIIRTVCGRCQGEDEEFARDCPNCGGEGYITRKVGGTVAANVLAHGTGALNIDGCRIGTEERTNNGGGASSINRVSRVAQGYRPSAGEWETSQASTVSGRWPANVVLDADQAAALDEQSGYQKDGVSVNRNRNGSEVANKIYGARGKDTKDAGYGSGGGASRFFYVAKAPKKERPVIIDADGKSHSHPTVKPLALMRWLARLVTPPGGKILDPFAGSGTMVEAALLEGFQIIAIERGGPEGTSESYYLPMIQQRIARTVNAS